VATEIYLIRHGETEWSRSRRYAGHRDIPLSAIGERQAHTSESYCAMQSLHTS